MSKIGATRIVLATAMIVAMGMGTGAYASFSDNFGGDLSPNWTLDPTDAATIVGGVAQLGGAQNPNDYSMFRMTDVVPGNQYHYQFDFNYSGLSPNFQDGGLYDTFAASLYFTDTPVLNWEQFLALLDADRHNLVSYTNPSDTGTVYASGGQVANIGGDWSEYTLNFNVPTGYTYAIPVFDVLKQNGLSDPDSSIVLLDNVSLQPVPEPVSMLMLGCVGGGIFLARKLRRQKS